MSKTPDGEEFFPAMTKEEEQKMIDRMIQRTKEMMTKYKGTPWGDQAAHELFQSLLDKADLPDPDVHVPYDYKTHIVTLMWVKPKAARIDVLISSDRPEASVYLDKPEPAVSYEQALDKIKQYFA